MSEARIAAYVAVLAFILTLSTSALVLRNTWLLTDLSLQSKIIRVDLRSLEASRASMEAWRKSTQQNRFTLEDGLSLRRETQEQLRALTKRIGELEQKGLRNE